jgi:hypothetical protein
MQRHSRGWESHHTHDKCFDKLLTITDLLRVFWWHLQIQGSLPTNNTQTLKTHILNLGPKHNQKVEFSPRRWKFHLLAEGILWSLVGRQWLMKMLGFNEPTLTWTGSSNRERRLGRSFPSSPSSPSSNYTLTSLFLSGNPRSTPLP